MLIRLYMHGVAVNNRVTTLLPIDLGVTTQNWLGRSTWTDDAYLAGSLDDVRSYDRALSERDIRYLAADR